jgi:two-component system response regulator HydG
MCETIAANLRRRDFQTFSCKSAEDALAALREKPFDVVLTDLKMPRVDGIQLCERIASNYSDVPVVVMTAFGSLESAVAAMRAGAYDFVVKPIETEMLALTLLRAVQHRSLKEQVKKLSETVRRSRGLGGMLGSSPTMQQLYEDIDRIASTEASVLITGESGTGKELVSRQIHQRSKRCNGPFVAINCAGIPEPLLESELFGHTRGAFTDAKADRRGLFLQADKGTLLLDELGDLPLPLQAKLLRVLEERSLRPVGGDVEQRFDVRVLAATNRDLETAVEEKRFREDLYFRINVIHLKLPPLRTLGSDVLVLAQHFLELFVDRESKKVAGISPPAAEKLLNYSWPGNVRELRNCIERAVSLTRTEQIIVEDLPEKIRDYRSQSLLFELENPAELLPMEEVERRYIEHVLRAVGQNRSQAAQILGMDRKTLYRKFARFESVTSREQSE